MKFHMAITNQSRMIIVDGLKYHHSFLKNKLDRGEFQSSTYLLRTVSHSA